jgi:hypothetical protein
MAFLDSTTAVIDAILTRKGRELLAKNDGSFLPLRVSIASMTAVVESKNAIVFPFLLF